MRLIAIDPGYERLGIAILEKPALSSRSGRSKEILLYSDCFKTDPKIAHSERLGAIGAEIERIIAEYGPEAMAMESLFFTANQKTAIKVAEARGVMLFLAAKHGLNVFEYGPGEIKLAVTGYGKSDKLAVISMVEKLIQIDKKIRHDDEYDAIAVGLTCFAIERF